jgi:hypothetical protein
MKEAYFFRYRGISALKETVPGPVPVMINILLFFAIFGFVLASFL